MIIDRDANNLHTVVGSVVQANEAAPKEMIGTLGIVTDKGPYGVTITCPQPDTKRVSRILSWEQVDYVGPLHLRRK